MQEKSVRVVIDTNIIISAALSEEGNPAQIFEHMLLEQIENFITDEIIEEVINVFKRPKISKLINENDVEFMIDNYKQSSKKVHPKDKLEVVKEDPDDNKFIECAVEAGAEYIISGDPHLLNLKTYKNIKIVSPAEFVKIINK